MDQNNIHRMSKFNQNTCEKPYIDLKTDLRKKSKKWFRKKMVSKYNTLWGKIEILTL